MGYYVQTLGRNKGKADYIVEHYAGERLIAPPNSFADISEGKALIVVIDNGPFEAAGFAFSEEEFAVFTEGVTDGRPREYVLVDWELACELTSFNLWKEKK